MRVVGVLGVYSRKPSADRRKSQPAVKGNRSRGRCAVGCERELLASFE